MRLIATIALLTLPAFAAAQNSPTLLPQEAADSPRLLAPGEFPASVSGFAFGGTLSAGMKKCREAKLKTSSYKNTSSCSGAVASSIFDGQVMLIPCDKQNKTCEVVVSLTDGSTASLRSVHGALVAKYGLAHATEKTFAETITACDPAKPNREAYADEEWWFGQPGARTAMIRLESQCTSVNTADGPVFYPVIRVRYENRDALLRHQNERAEARANY